MRADFYITDIQKTNKGVKVFAKHLFFLTNKLYVREMKYKDKTCADVMRGLSGFISDKNKFVFDSDIVDIHSIHMEHKTLYEVLTNSDYSILKVWQGVYKRDNYNISYLSRRGRDTEYIIAKRKNIADLNIREDADFVATKIYLRAKKRKTKKEEQNNPEDEWLETVVESPLINVYPFPLIQYREYEDSFRDVKSLKKYGEELFSIYRVDLPKETFTLKATDEINSYKLDINDTVLIHYEDYDVHKKIEVSKYTYSPMRNKYIDITFGYRSRSFADTLTLSTNKKIEEDRKKFRRLSEYTEKKIIDLDGAIDENKLETEKSLNNITHSIDKKIEEKEKTITESFSDKLEKVVLNLKSYFNEEVKKLSLDIDEEKVKALSNAQTEKYIRSKQGQAELIQAITADIVWLNSIITSTEMLNAIVAKINIAEIKKLIVDTAFIESIISKEEFQQQFQYGGVNVVNIFSKMRDSLLSYLQANFEDEFKPTICLFRWE